MIELLKQTDAPHLRDIFYYLQESIQIDMCNAQEYFATQIKLKLY